MSWFKRKDKKIKDSKKKSIPDGLWDKCPSCNEILYRPELEKNLSVCQEQGKSGNPESRNLGGAVGMVGPES